MKLQSVHAYNGQHHTSKHQYMFSENTSCSISSVLTNACTPDNQIHMDADLFSIYEELLRFKLKNGNNFITTGRLQMICVPPEYVA